MKFVKVAIGILLKKNKIYIIQNKYKKDKWEFPGGKAKKNENIIRTLKRELLEEIGIIISKFSILQYIQCKNKLKLYFFLIHRWKREPFSKESSLDSWVYIYNLYNYSLPTPNYSVIQSLQKYIF